MLQSAQSPLLCFPSPKGAALAFGSSGLTAALGEGCSAVIDAAGSTVVSVLKE